MIDHRSISSLNVIASTDAKGRQYIRAYKNKWVPKTAEKKGHSVMLEQHHLGTLQPNGAVIMNENFLLTHPEFADRQWYYHKNRLYDFEAYKKLVPSAREDVPEPESNLEEDEALSATSKHFGATFAAFNLFESSKIATSLTKIFGHDDAIALMGQAIYNTLSHHSSDSFPDWAEMHYLPKEAVMSGQRLSELFARVSPEKMDAFWLLRYQHIKKLQTDQSPRFCFIDSTSISTHSTTIDHAEFGHAKRDPDLKQVNLTVVMDQASGEIIYAYETAGSINDVSLVSDVTKRMAAIGFEMKDFVFIADRGYCSAYNLGVLMESATPFVVASKIEKGKATELLLKRHIGKLLSYQAFDYRMQSSAVTEKEIFQVAGLEKTVYTHFYCDQQRRAEECQYLRGLLLRALDVLNNVDKQGNHKLSANQMQEARPYLMKYKCSDDTASSHHKKPVEKWGIDEKAWESFELRSGVFCLRTDVYSDPIAALELYRARNMIEMGFDAFKNSCNGSRLRTSNSSYYGKLLAYLLGESLMMMLYQKHRQLRDAFPQRREIIPGDSVKQLLLKLEKIQIRRTKVGRPWIADAITKKQRTWLEELFNIKALPRQIL